MRGNWKAIAILGVGAILIIGTIWTLVNFIGLQASLIWTALLGAIGWAVQSSIRQKQEYQRLLADQKRLQYFEFLDFLNEFIGRPGGGTAPPVGTEPGQNADRLLQLRRWSLRLTMIGSDEVVRAWNQARMSGIIEPTSQGRIDQEQQTLSLFRAWGGLWLALRKDCGHFDTTLTVPDVLASFVNDIESYRSRL